MAQWHVVPWIAMWLIALGLFVAGKAASIATLPAGAPLGPLLGYLLLSPGMDPTSFFRRGSPGQLPFRNLFECVFNILMGTQFLWCLPRFLPTEDPLLRGWSGMVGMVLILHFGVLEIALMMCRAAGFGVPRLMNHPLRARSVVEFWSVRWNTSFRELAHRFVFRPLARQRGVAAALFLTYAVSGLVHDLIISVPAGGGYGLPTLYFLLQGCAILFERSPLGTHCLRHPIAARCFVATVVAAPTPLLFHSLFVSRVILPFMSAIGALPKGMFP